MPGRNPPSCRTRALRRVATLLTLVLAAAGCSRGDAFADDAAPSTSAPPASTTSSTSSTSTSTTTTTSTLPPPPPVPVADLRLQVGDQGDAVRALEQQLLTAGFWLDKADDGVFDESTLHAVTALQKTNGLERTGVFDAAALAALDQWIRPLPRSVTGPVIEVDLARQVLFVVRDGMVNEIFDVSTGRRPGWTPVGEYAVNREVNGIRNAPLGRLYRPKYFVGGVAVHGYSKVPAEPASHGCVRVTNAVMDHIWDTDLMPKGMPVWVY
jgi:peptidoglycan hydrolase-like protein with peptidoglycan-binding domain